MKLPRDVVRQRQGKAKVLSADTVMFAIEAQAPEPKKSRKICDSKARRSQYWKGGSDSKWRAVRAERLKLDPLCSCGERATIVDHVVPLFRGGDKYDIKNTQSICKPCHDAKSAEEMGKRGRVRVDPGTGWPIGEHWWNRRRG